MPLLIALHGAYANGAFMERYSALSQLADRSGFAVVYPDAAGPRWRIAHAEGDADVKFLDTLIDRLLSAGCVDAGRVSVVGVSNGGGMAARLACEADERLAGLVTVAGSYRTLPRCRARWPLSVLEIHGTADTVVPYRGDRRDPQSDILAWVRGWATRDGCPAALRQSKVARDVVRLAWSGCRGSAAVQHLRLIGGAHAWPGADPPDAGPDLGVSASQEAWTFLRGRRRAGGVSDDRDRLSRR
jgi:polyhydroxybutyrate depolymerase